MKIYLANFLCFGNEKDVDSCISKGIIRAGLMSYADFIKGNKAIDRIKKIKQVKGELKK
jgi:hypothetical protein